MRRVLISTVGLLLLTLTACSQWQEPSEIKLSTGTVLTCDSITFFPKMIQCTKNMFTDKGTARHGIIRVSYHDIIEIKRSPNK